jgi:hypothetical protein
MSGSSPQVPAATEVPTIDSDAVKEAAANARKAALLRKGRASTILTEPRNAAEPTVYKKTLLGE